MTGMPDAYQYAMPARVINYNAKLGQIYFFYLILVQVTLALCSLNQGSHIISGAINRSVPFSFHSMQGAYNPRFDDPDSGHASNCYLFTEGGTRDC
jgi:hypothetical protein